MINMSTEITNINNILVSYYKKTNNKLDFSNNNIVLYREVDAVEKQQQSKSPSNKKSQPSSVIDELQTINVSKSSAIIRTSEDDRTGNDSRSQSRTKNIDIKN